MNDLKCLETFVWVARLGGFRAAAANSQMTAIIRTLRRQTQIFDLRSLPERFESTCREHLAITAAIGGGQADEAASAMRRHLESVKQSIVTRLG